MERYTFLRAIELQKEIDSIERFLCDCKNNRSIRFYKKKTHMVTVSDYMSETKLYELSPRLREKFILVLKKDLEELREEFSKLN